MPNIKLVLEYNGSGFHGWQIQPGLRTIQSEVHSALETVLRTKIKHVQASGRTDEGVHAKAQVVNFYVDETPDLIRLKRSVSSLLKGEVSVVGVEIVDDSFHSLRDSKQKFYRYSIYHADVPPVLRHGQVWLVNADLDIAKMQRAAKQLEGEHDFESFRCSGCTAKSTIKTIHSSEIISEPPYLYYEVKGSGFLKQMVRVIVGTLVMIGKGAEVTIPEILDAKDRKEAGPTAPPYGLCLEKVTY